MKKFLFCFSIITLHLSLAFGQQSSETAYGTEAFGSVSTGSHTPFWMTSHTWGIVPLSANNAYVRGEISHKAIIKDDLSWGAGLDLAGSTKHAFNTVWLQQAYAEATWRKWNLRVGPKESYTSFLDENLSSGDFILSTNARPMPEANLSLVDFVAVPFTKNKLYLRGNIAFGKMLDGDYVESIAGPAHQNYYKGISSHHKSIYFRFGDFRKGNTFRLTFGLQHFAYFDGHGVIDGVENRSRTNLSEIFRTVFIAKEGGPDGIGVYKYKTGSHFGTYTVKFDYKAKNKDTFSTYWHHFIEDGSSAGPQSIRDMLAGVEYKSDKRQLLSGAVFEYVYTKDQSGPVHFNYGMDDSHQYLKSKGNGMDDYYNNVQYIQGPSYYGRSFGTPLFLSPEYNTDGTINFKSNRIIAYHGAIEGYLSKKFSYRLLATYGETWGRHRIPYLATRKGVASSIDLTYRSLKAEGVDFKLTLAFNHGSFFEDNSFGTGISVSKRGIISKK